MKIEQSTKLVSRVWIATALLLAAFALPACTENETANADDEAVAEAESAVGGTGDNNYPPYAVDSDPLKRSVTDHFNLTSPTNPDVLQLCADGTVTSTGCTLRNEWKNWMNADSTNRSPTMIAVAKCAVESGFTISSSSGTFAGQWGLYQSWKSSRLNGQDKRERISSCILTLLNGNNVELKLCIIGPGGAPFSDACADTSLTNREGGFFGDLFAATPTAYVAGPDTQTPVLSGRACNATQGTYCCAEDDTTCTHRVVLAGAILGDPAINFANKRCNADLVTSGLNQYCPSYYSTREPGRSYTNVFTTFVPTAQ
jgi:hypothetical protein